MARNLSQWLKTFVPGRLTDILLIATTSTVALGVSVYGFYTTEGKCVPTDAPRTSPAKITDGRSKGRVKTTATDASGNSTSTKWDHNWDSRHPEYLAELSGEETSGSHREHLQRLIPSATRHLILIRHGLFIKKHTSDEHRTLTSLGQEQSEMTGQYLRNLGLNYTRMVSSTMSRAAETADIMHKFLPWLKLERDDLLREGRPVVAEPNRSWKPDHIYFQHGARIEAAFRKYFHRADPQQKNDSVEIVVCHANVIRYFVCRALQFPLEAWGRIALPHASVTHVFIRPSGNVYLLGLGDVGHMPFSKVTVASRS